MIIVLNSQQINRFVVFFFWGGSKDLADSKYHFTEIYLGKSILEEWEKQRQIQNLKGHFWSESSPAYV